MVRDEEHLSHHLIAISAAMPSASSATIVPLSITQVGHHGLRTMAPRFADRHPAKHLYRRH
jgi:hypothetical protein